eukprot:TRINITY_DN5565_c0_g1_i3.p2 TRINITY_DN5565_c0_g1~~TRINITY_DN5565_c0_g1_i3.p2  ORF type:complete len:121 (-),score=35.41 TRINITY_DN5565_c0_g1_i3:1045-1407(-)
MPGLNHIEKHSSEEGSDFSPRLPKCEKATSLRREYKKGGNGNSLAFTENRYRRKRESSLYDEDDCRRSSRTFAELVLLAEEEDDLEEMKRNIKAMRKVARRYLAVVCKKQNADYSDEGEQ